MSRPAGSATAIAMEDVMSVPATSGSTPNSLWRNAGVHTVPNRNSVTRTSRKNANVSATSTATRPAVTRTEPAAPRTSADSMTRSARRRKGFDHTRACLLMFLVADGEVADVAHQRWPLFEQELDERRDF